MSSSKVGRCRLGEEVGEEVTVYATWSRRSTSGRRTSRARRALRNPPFLRNFLPAHRLGKLSLGPPSASIAGGAGTEVGASPVATSNGTEDGGITQALASSNAVSSSLD